MMVPPWQPFEPIQLVALCRAVETRQGQDAANQLNMCRTADRPVHVQTCVAVRVES